jgi:ribose transport system substrate-binding protein
VRWRRGHRQRDVGRGRRGIVGRRGGHGEEATTAEGATSAAEGETTAAASGEKYKVGVSNTLQGNGWREEMICSIKAQAKVSGQVDELIIANKTQGTPQQIADIAT